SSRPYRRPEKVEQHRLLECVVAPIAAPRLEQRADLVGLDPLALNIVEGLAEHAGHKRAEIGVARMLQVAKQLALAEASRRPVERALRGVPHPRLVVE